MLDIFHMIIVAVLENFKGFRLFNIVRQTVPWVYHSHRNYVYSPS